MVLQTPDLNLNLTKVHREDFHCGNCCLLPSSPQVALHEKSFSLFSGNMDIRISVAKRRRKKKTTNGGDCIQVTQSMGIYSCIQNKNKKIPTANKVYWKIYNFSSLKLTHQTITI